MKLTYILCYITCCLTLGSTHSQSILSGKVLDINNNPISNANVLGIPNDKSEKLVFTTTNETGDYKIILSPNKTYKLTFSHISYINLNKTFKSTESSASLTITLEESINELEEIIITEKAPITIKKDTTTYRVDAFSNGKERKLRELLKKLPGLEVDKNGGITINGKKVTQLLVDGKQFFNGDTKLGVNNIPADVAEEVEIIEDYHETSFLKGLKDSEEIAMNIKLKEDKKRFLFGDVEAGGGIENRYKLHPKIFKYAPKLTFNFIGDLNNTFDKSFTLRDYINFNGGLDFDNPSSLFNSNIANLLTNSDYTSNNHAFGGLNNQYNPNEKNEFKTFILALSDESDYKNRNTINYLDNNLEETRSEDRKNTTRLLLTRLAHKYTPNDNTVLKTEINFERNNVNALAAQQSDFFTDNSAFEEITDSQFQNFSASVGFDKKFNKNHVTSVEADFSIVDDISSFNNRSDFNIYSVNVPIIDDSFFNVFQHKDNNNTTLNFNATHYWVLNRKNHIYFKLGNLYRSNMFSSLDFQELTSGSSNQFQDFNNNLTSRYNTFYSGINYKRIIGDFITELKLRYENQTLTNFQDNTKGIISNNNLIPEIKITWDLNQKNKLTLDYTKRYNYAPYINYALGNILTGFNSTFRGNENLNLTSAERFGIIYSYRKTYGLSIYGSFSYRKNTDIISNDFQVQNIFNTITPIQLRDNNTFYNSRIRFSYNKPYWQMKYGLRNILANTNSIINQNPITSKQNTWSNTLNFNTKFEQNPNIEVNTDYRITNNETDNLTNKQTSLSIETIVSYDINDWKFNASYNYTNFKNEASFQTDTSFDDLNASIFYNKEDGLWSFELIVHNLTNNRSNLFNSFGTTLINQIQTFVFPRYILFNVVYKF